MKRVITFSVIILHLACGGERPRPAPPPAAVPPTGETTIPSPSKNVPLAPVDIVWEEWAPYGVADSGLDWPAGAVAGVGKLYLVGTKRLPPPPGKQRLKRAAVAITEISPANIKEVATLPTSFGECARAAVARGPGGEVWFVGGAYTPPPIKTVPAGEFKYNELCAATGTVYRWKPDGREITLETYLPVPRYEAVAFVDDGLLYVVGGIFDAADAAAGNNKQIHRYDPRDGLWTKLHDLPLPLAAPASAVAKNELYVIGGKQLRPSHITTNVLRYDLNYYKWQKGPSLPAPRAGATAVVIGDFIYLVGGKESEGTTAGTRFATRCFRFDLTRHRWETIPTPIPEGTTLCAFDGAHFYLIGTNKTYRGTLKSKNL